MGRHALSDYGVLCVGSAGLNHMVGKVGLTCPWKTGEFGLTVIMEDSIMSHCALGLQD